jgi:hypothetical protein
MYSASTYQHQTNFATNVFFIGRFILSEFLSLGKILIYELHCENDVTHNFRKAKLEKIVRSFVKMSADFQLLMNMNL